MAEKLKLPLIEKLPEQLGLAERFSALGQLALFNTAETEGFTIPVTHMLYGSYREV